jgi:hypothetical protein
MTIKTPRYLLVGAGLFAQKTYIPRLQELDERGRAKLMAIVEVYGNEHLRPLYSHLPLSKQQCPQEYLELDLMIRRLRIDCVIISTEPFAHKSDGLRALEKGLNVITDKSIITRKGACTVKVRRVGLLMTLKSYRMHMTNFRVGSRPASQSSVTASHLARTRSLLGGTGLQSPAGGLSHV